MPFALVGRWSRGVLVGSDPVEVVDRVPSVAPGWWVGFLGFGTRYEALPPAPPRPVPMPDARFALYDHVLSFDGSGWWLLGDQRRFEELQERLSAPVAPRSWSVGPLSPAGAGASGHVAAVADCVERIAAGELFQANLCLRLEGTFSGSPVDAFADACSVLRPSYGAYMDGVLSFSPELFLRRSGRSVETGPIKGTSTDRAALEASAKDAAEHVMIVDLMRNDLGRVCEYGSIVADPPHLEPHPGLWHMVSRVHGVLRDDVEDAELLRATFPPGSVTGAPKIQALKVISALEGTAREVYTGAIGVLAPEGLELNVAIRTLEVSGDRAWLGCGGGIVADSVPGLELREAFDKAAPIAAALGTTIASAPPRAAPSLPRVARPDPALGVFETMLVRIGSIVALDAHLARLRASVRELYGHELPPDLAARLVAAAATAALRARLRVDVRPDGSVELALSPAGPPVLTPLTPIVVPGGFGAHKWVDRIGFDALICDADGTVLEASSANVWALIGSELVTPPADGRILPGVTRRWLLDRGVGRVGSFRLEEARTLVITSSIRGAAAATPDALQLAEDLRARLAERR